MNLTGQQLGPYKIERELGRGGMAIIYYAIDTTTQEGIALKVLLPYLAEDANTLRRFHKEGETGMRLRHPNIVKVFDTGEDQGHHYIALEYAARGTLSAWLRERREPIPVRETVSILRRVASALDYAHSRNILHRDVKPSNILIAKNDQILLSDFGVARRLSADHTMITMTGHAIGTPMYMSPEQISDSEDIDQRADIYSLGVVGYLMLTAVPPFEADSQVALMHKILNGAPTPPETYNPSLPTGVNYALLKVLSKEPAKRYATASEFVNELERGVEWAPTSQDWSTLFRSIAPEVDRRQSTHRQGETAPSALSEPIAPVKPARQRGGGLRGWGLGLAGILLGALAMLFIVAPQWLPSLQQLTGASPTIVERANVEKSENANSSGTTGNAENPVANAVAPSPTATQPTSTETPTSSEIPVTNTPRPAIAPILVSTYRDPNLPISIDLPTEWQQLRRGNAIYFESPDHRAWFFIEELDNNGNITSTELLIDEYLQTNNSPLRDPIVLTQSQQKLNGHEIFEETIEAIWVGGARLQVRLLAVSVNGRSLIVGGNVESDQSAFYIPLFDSVFSSFSILEPVVEVSLISTETATPIPTESATATLPPSDTPTMTEMPTFTATPVPTATESATATVLPSPSATATPQPTVTVTDTATSTPSPIATRTALPTATASATRKPTSTAVPTPTATALPTVTNTPFPTATATSTRRPTSTALPTATSLSTATVTATKEPTATATRIVTQTPTQTPVPTATATKTPKPTSTHTLTPRPTATPIPTATDTATAPPLPTNTQTPSPIPPTATKIPPTATQQSVVPSVQLIEPLDAFISGVRTFSWQATAPLVANQAFEMVIWPTGGDAMAQGFGPVGYSLTNQVTVNLDKAANAIPAFVAGRDYQWGVLLVETNPYRRLQYLGGGHQFRFDRSGGSSDGGSSGGGSSDGDSQPPVPAATETPRI